MLRYITGDFVANANRRKYYGADCKDFLCENNVLHCPQYHYNLDTVFVSIGSRTEYVR